MCVQAPLGHVRTDSFSSKSMFPVRTQSLVISFLLHQNTLGFSLRDRWIAGDTIMALKTRSDCFFFRRGSRGPAHHKAMHFPVIARITVVEKYLNLFTLHPPTTKWNEVLTFPMPEESTYDHGGMTRWMIVFYRNWRFVNCCNNMFFSCVYHFPSQNFSANLWANSGTLRNALRTSSWQIRNPSPFIDLTPSVSLSRWRTNWPRSQNTRKSWYDSWIFNAFF